MAKPQSAAVRVVVDDLRETLRDFQSRFGYGRGIAAPQIGAPGPDRSSTSRWSSLAAHQSRDRGRGQRGLHRVGRPLLVPQPAGAGLAGAPSKVRYQDLKGAWHLTEPEGDRAELLQHEIDHLDGVLAVDRPHGLDPFCLRGGTASTPTRGRFGEPEPRSEKPRHAADPRPRCRSHPTCKRGRGRRPPPGAVGGPFPLRLYLSLFPLPSSLSYSPGGGGGGHGTGARRTTRPRASIRSRLAWMRCT
ncbi:MAG: peptide deformylase [Gemmatimonadetes bacterium]|nr:peptide deformylase [Gemmatimonadota bacterium]